MELFSLSNNNCKIRKLAIVLSIDNASKIRAVKNCAEKNEKYKANNPKNIPKMGIIVTIIGRFLIGLSGVFEEIMVIIASMAAKAIDDTVMLALISF